nr:SDR family NAD(P)-dependent oxidoreductase [Roseospira goensis]
MSGQRILVTGARRGLGFAIAARFRDAGARLCLFGRSGMEAARESLGAPDALAVTGDVTDAADLDAAVAQMTAAFGGVDGVVTAAGITQVAPIDSLTPAQFRAVLDTNVTGTWLTVRAALPAMPAGGGWVVMLGSVYGADGAPDRSPYCASKGAVHMLAQALAVELGPRGVRVNVVAPTGVRTPMVQDLIDRGVYDEAGVAGRTPLGRLATAEEVAAACAFLASGEAGMVTGTVLPVDGGWLANGFIQTRGR